MGVTGSVDGFCATGSGISTTGSAWAMTSLVSDAIFSLIGKLLSAWSMGGIGSDVLESVGGTGRVFLSVSICRGKTTTNIDLTFKNTNVYSSDTSFLLASISVVLV